MKKLLILLTIFILALTIFLKQDAVRAMLSTGSGAVLPAQMSTPNAKATMAIKPNKKLEKLLLCRWSIQGSITQKLPLAGEFLLLSLGH